MAIHLVYMTAGSFDEAKRIGKALVSSRLAACVNIIDNVRSIYRWDGEIQDDKEVVFIAKTIASLVPELVKTVSGMHSYDCPCVVSLPIQDGNSAFLDWVAGETQ